MHPTLKERKEAERPIFTGKPGDLDYSVLEGIRHRSCCMKMRYASIQDAEEMAERINATATDGSVHSYYCVFCNDFHNGHDFGKQATREYLEDLDELLMFDFGAPCVICGNANRFSGCSRKACGRSGKRYPSGSDWVLPEEWKP